MNRLQGPRAALRAAEPVPQCRHQALAVLEPRLRGREGVGLVLETAEGDAWHEITRYKLGSLAYPGRQRNTAQDLWNVSALQNLNYLVTPGR